MNFGLPLCSWLLMSDSCLSLLLMQLACVSDDGREKRVALMHTRVHGSEQMHSARGSVVLL